MRKKKNRRTLKKRTRKTIALTFFSVALIYSLLFFQFILFVINVISMSTSEIFGYAVVKNLSIEDLKDEEGRIDALLLRETMDQFVQIDAILSARDFEQVQGPIVEIGDQEENGIPFYRMVSIFWVDVTIDNDLLYSSEAIDRGLFDIELFVTDEGAEVTLEEWISSLPLFQNLYTYIENFNQGSSRSIFNDRGELVGHLDVRINNYIAFIFVLALFFLQLFLMGALALIALLVSNLLVLPIMEPIKTFNEKLALLAKEDEKLEAGVVLEIKRPLREFEEMRNSINQIIKSMNSYSHIINQRKEQLEEVKVELEAQNRELQNKTSQLVSANHVMKQLKEEAEIATRSKSNFLANMSHEIRTPMNAIIGLNDLLERTELTEKQYDYVQKTGIAAKNLLGIINDILDFSKIEAGKITLENISFSIDEVLTSVSSVVGKKAFDKGLEFVIVKDKNVPAYLKGDPLRLGQVLINLISNAIKFTAEGEVVVRIELDQRERDEEKRAKLRCSVKDTGIGLTEEQMDRLFHAFSQGDPSTTRKYGGTGLGLTISQAIINMMEGEIGVTSKHGLGSTFYFTVWLDKGEDRALLTESLSERIRSLKVLVVDDHPEAREVMSEYLVYFGMEVSQVSSGEEAIAAIDESYDLILMDWRMEGINGLEAWKAIQEKLEGKTLPKIIIITAYGGEDLGEGVDEVLIKPVNQSLLLDSILLLFGEREERSKERRASSDFSPLLKKIRGASILLVEDNEINRQIAKEILANEGFWVDIAENGEKAYEKAKQNVYDLVLMDLQMPVMDGIEATKRIRSEEGIDSSLPIIALSADAVSGTREMVMAAGMNGFVPKPIDKRELFGALKKWIPERDKEEFNRPIKEKEIEIEIERDEAEEAEIETKNLWSKISSINYEEGLARLGGHTELYLEILKKYEKSSEETVKRAEESLAKGDREMAKRELHSLKGVSSNIGATKIEQLAKDAEEMLKEEGALLETISLAELKQEVESAREEIRALLEEERAAGEAKEREGEKEGLPLDELKEKLKELKELLDEYDTRSLDILGGIRVSLIQKTSQPLVAKVEKMIKEYRYEEALEICETMEEDLLK